MANATLRQTGKWVLGGLALAVSAAGIVGVASMGNRPGNAAKAVTERSDQVTSAPWSTGEMRAFTAELQTRVLAGDQKLVDLAVTGVWKVTRTDQQPTSSGGSIRAIGQLAVDHLKLATSPESESRVKAALAETVVFEISDRGLISGVGFEKADLADCAPAFALHEPLDVGWDGEVCHDAVYSGGIARPRKE